MAGKSGSLSIPLLTLQEAIKDYQSSRDSNEIIPKDHMTLIRQSCDLLLQSQTSHSRIIEPGDHRTTELLPHPVTSRDHLFTFYDLYLERSFILSLLELLCISLDSQNFYTTLFKELFQIIQYHNRFVSMTTKGVASNKLKLTFADVSDIFVSSRGHVLGDCILATKPLPLHSLVSWIEFDSQLTRLITGTTSLLSDDEETLHSDGILGAKTWRESNQLVSSESEPGISSELEDIIELVNWRV